MQKSTIMRLPKPALFLTYSLLISVCSTGIAQGDSVLTMHQAKVGNNPTIGWNQEAYNLEENKYLRARNQFEAQISQAVSIAGKHTNTVKLARITAASNRC